MDTPPSPELNSHALTEALIIGPDHDAIFASKLDEHRVLRIALTGEEDPGRIADLSTQLCVAKNKAIGVLSLLGTKRAILAERQLLEDSFARAVAHRQPE